MWQRSVGLIFEKTHQIATLLVFEIVIPLAIVGNRRFELADGSMFWRVVGMDDSAQHSVAKQIPISILLQEEERGVTPCQSSDINIQSLRQHPLS